MRFEEVSDSFLRLAKEVQDKYFPELNEVKIKYLFDTKKRTSGGQITLGKCSKTNDLIRHLTVEEANSVEGYDYLIVIDKIAYDNIDERDRIRLIRHELRHAAAFDPEATNPCKIAPHDINDFEAEVVLNADSPGWMRRAANLVADIYDQQKDMEGEQE